MVNSIEIPFKFAKRRSGDVAICYADPSLAEEVLEWQAKYNLNDMCIDAWSGVKDYGFN